MADRRPEVDLPRAPRPPHGARGPHGLALFRRAATASPGPCLEAHLEDGLLVRLEVHAAPLELETVRRFPRQDRTHLERARAGGQLDRLEQATACARLERQDARALAHDSELGTLLPP